ncbi:MAG: sulfotransferase domain-containing protein [Pseudomonadaceae bacterium]
MFKSIGRQLAAWGKGNQQGSNDPDFMIIGAQKAGTSSLFHYLAQHPEITGSTTKEVGHFHNNRHLGKSIADYRRFFVGPPSQLYFEATPLYLYYPGVAAEIQRHYPEIKLIVLLREPGKRAYSAWNHYRDIFVSGKYKKAILGKQPLPGSKLAEKLFQNREAFPSFRECIDIELELMASNDGFEPGILRRGLYLEQLEEYWKYFNRDQMLILGFRDLVDDLDGTLDKVTRFLGVAPLNAADIAKEPKNQRKYSEPMRQQDREFLDEFYAAPNQKLFEVIGDLNW